ncbi:MAG TPA: ABC transporter ATP-binding protein [Chthonomonadaceae bacterium]|nr:ABC transporter ATP-binding protein [Chthonomonadaceae bacterium]
MVSGMILQQIGSQQRVEAKRSLVEAVELTKIYKRGTESVRALDGVSFALAEGAFTAIVGPSGAGKSTLLHLLGCMDTPTSGTLTLAGRPTSGLNDAALTRLRREEVGFVFQHFGLLPTLTVAENVALPTLFSRREARQKAVELLERVGLAHRAHHRPHELSGGEMQRAAIARALINSPRLLMADEPTGNLDSANGEAILALFQQLNHDGLTVVVVTHNEALAEAAPRRLTLRDGKLVADTMQ